MLSPFLGVRQSPRPRAPQSQPARVLAKRSEHIACPRAAVITHEAIRSDVARSIVKVRRRCRGTPPTARRSYEISVGVMKAVIVVCRDYLSAHHRRPTSRRRLPESERGRRLEAYGATGVGGTRVALPHRMRPIALSFALVVIPVATLAAQAPQTVPPNACRLTGSSRPGCQDISFAGFGMGC